MSFIVVLMFLAFGLMFYRIIKKNNERRDQAALKEEEFLASMRANPRGTAIDPAHAQAPVLPIVLARQAGQEPVLPIDLPSAAGQVATLKLGGLDHDTVPGVGTPASAAVPVPLAAPRDGLCMVCGEGVDLRANDQMRWGVKVQEPGADRLVWVHFHCLASRLGEAQSMRQALLSLVEALDAALTGGSKEAKGASSALSLKDALVSAHKVLAANTQELPAKTPDA